jgi:hypothetical protein
LSLPYPKLARAARIEGDIDVAVNIEDVALNIEPDGHVQSAVIVSGPLLRQIELPAEVNLPAQKVTVWGWEGWTCDPRAVIQKFAAAKCLFLWKCGRREIVQPL